MTWIALLLLVASVYLLLQILRQLKAITRTLVTLYNGTIEGTDRPRAHFGPGPSRNDKL